MLQMRIWSILLIQSGFYMVFLSKQKLVSFEFVINKNASLIFGALKILCNVHTCNS